MVAEAKEAYLHATDLDPKNTPLANRARLCKFNPLLRWERQGAVSTTGC
jgi:hypothetical protein